MGGNSLMIPTYHLHVESKKAKLMETETRVPDTRGWGGENRLVGERLKEKKTNKQQHKKQSGTSRHSQVKKT